MSNLAGLENDVRSDAERQMAVGAAENEWRQQHLQLESATGSEEAHIGGQPGIIDEQAGMLFRAASGHACAC